MNENRRLAAILFADIEGYTAKMQDDESTALRWLEKFKQSIHHEVASHSGQIEQFYGDGCLITFSSSSSAVSCAIELQKKFNQDLYVPVRIGLHSGDVLSKDDNIYGDSVNIASRIESMGKSGSILLSKAVRDQIKNKPGFSTRKLGQFTFKNVKEPMALYAIDNEGIIVPEITSHFDSPQSPVTIIRSRQIAIPLIGLMMALVGFGIWKVFIAPQQTKLSAEILESRIAVLPFENRTNNPDLDALGEMAADWIIEGLMNLENVKAVSFQNIKSNIQHASLNPVSNKDLFGKLTGAEKLIQGSYYKDGDEIIVSSKISDASSRELEFSLPRVVGSEKDISHLVNSLTEKILTYFNIEHGYLSFLQDRVPNYSAYKKFLLALETFGKNSKETIQYLTQAIEIDTLFFHAYSAIFIQSTNTGDYRFGDSILALIEQRFDQFSPFEQLNVNWMKAIIKRDLYELRKLSKEMWMKDPHNGMFNYLAGYYQGLTHRPKSAIEILQILDTSTIQERIKTPSNAWWCELYAHNLIRLDQLNEAQNILDYIPQEFENLDKHRLEAQILVNQGKQDEIDVLLRQLENRGKSPNYITEVNTAAVVAYLLQDQSRQAQTQAQYGVNYVLSQPETVESPHNLPKAEALYYAGEYARAERVYSELLAKSDAGSIYNKYGNWHYMSKLGCIYARQNKTEKAKEILHRIDEITTATPSGRYTYAKARIQAQLGNHDLAIRLMKQAMTEGFPNEYGEFRYGEDPEFLSLLGIEAFDEFVLQE